MPSPHLVRVHSSNLNLNNKPNTKIYIQPQLEKQLTQQQPFYAIRYYIHVIQTRNNNIENIKTSNIYKYFKKQ